MRARRSIAVLSGATLVLTLTTVGVGAIRAANADGQTFAPAGTLTLSTGPGATGWSYGDATQPIGTLPTHDDDHGCALTPTSGPLATLSPTGPAGSVPSLGHDGIGVSQGTRWWGCGSINPVTTFADGAWTTTNESLTIGLAGRLAASGVLDIGADDEATVKVETKLAGAVVSTTVLMADERPAPAVLPKDVTTWCQVTDGDDDDPVGTSDHCALALGGPNFDSVTITTLSGRASLSGGGTWGATADQHRTTFAIVAPVAAAVVDAGINCTDQKVATASTTSGVITGVQLTRLENGATDPASACQGLPYTLSSDAAGATFHKPSVDSQKTAQFTVTITRTYASGKASLKIPAPLVDWEDGKAPISLALCPGGLVSETRDANGVPTSIDYSKIGKDQSPKADVQFACVYAEDALYNNATGTQKVVDHIYFTGDIKFPSP